MFPPWIHWHTNIASNSTTRGDINLIWNTCIFFNQKAGIFPQVEKNIFFQHPTPFCFGGTKYHRGNLVRLRISSLAEIWKTLLLLLDGPYRLRFEASFKTGIYLRKRCKHRVFCLFVGFFVYRMILSLKMLKMEDLVAHIGYVNSSKKMAFILIGSTSHQKLNICTRASCPAASISTCGPNRPLLVMIRFGRRVWRGFEKYKVFVSLRSTKYNTFSIIITQTKPWSIQKSFWSSIFLMSSMISKSLRLKSW